MASVTSKSGSSVAAPPSQDPAASRAGEEGSERYGKIEKLGEGTYGVVYKAVARKTQQLVALKKIRVDVWSEGVPATAMREISVLKEIHHSAVVDLSDIFVSYSGNLYLVFELMDGDLKDVLDEQRRYVHDADKAAAAGRDPASIPRPIAQSTLPQNKRGLPLELTRAFVFQMLSGVHACHTHRVLHRDLKPHNLLVNKTGEMKLADFGLARPYAVPARRYTSEVVTLWYRAPEVLLGAETHLPALDIWSVGCIMAEMVTGMPLFPGDSEVQQVERIFLGLGTPTEEIWPGCTRLPQWKTSFPRCRGRPLSELVPNLPRAAADLLASMMQYDPTRRISAHSALTHPFFDGLTIDQAHLIAKAALSNARMPPIPTNCLSMTEADKAAMLAHSYASGTLSLAGPMAASAVPVASIVAPAAPAHSAATLAAAHAPTKAAPKSSSSSSSSASSSSSSAASAVAEPASRNDDDGPDDDPW